MMKTMQALLLMMTITTQRKNLTALVMLMMMTRVLIASTLQQAVSLCLRTCVKSATVVKRWVEEIDKSLQLTICFINRMGNQNL